MVGGSGRGPRVPNVSLVLVHRLETGIFQEILPFVSRLMTGKLDFHPRGAAIAQVGMARMVMVFDLTCQRTVQSGQLANFRRLVDVLRTPVGQTILDDFFVTSIGIGDFLTGGRMTMNHVKPGNFEPRFPLLQLLLSVQSQ